MKEKLLKLINLIIKKTKLVNLLFNQQLILIVVN